MSLTPEHINYLLRKRGLTAPVGRPFKEQVAEAAAEKESQTEPAQENTGLFFPRSSQGGTGGNTSH